MLIEWKYHKQLRFGQLLGDVFGEHNLYYLSDEDLLKLVQEYTNEMAKQREQE